MNGILATPSDGVMPQSTSLGITLLLGSLVVVLIIAAENNKFYREFDVFEIELGVGDEKEKIEDGLKARFCRFLFA